MKQCDKGHFFDENRYPECPYCRPETAPASPVFAAPDAGIGKTVAISTPPPVSDERGKTVGVVQKKLGMDPVVGFVVCTEGPHKGRGYSLIAGRNFIGRSPNMEIALTDDDTVSRDGHSMITYDAKHNQFFASAGTGRGVTYLNNTLVETPVLMNAYDVLEVGSCKLTFLPFCGEKFKWE